MSRSLGSVALTGLLTVPLLSMSGEARAVSFVDDLLVERFEIAGAATFVDEFDDDVFPGTVAWLVPCGSASESGGALAIGATGPGCPNDLFLAAAVAPFTGEAVVSADFNLPLPSENEFVGIQIGSGAGTDLVNLTTSRVGGQIFVAIGDENGVFSTPLDPDDLPTSFFTFQISLAIDVGTGELIPTASGSVDGNPLFSLEVADLGLDPGGLAGGDAFFGEILAGPVVPEPSLAALLAASVAGFGLVARRRIDERLRSGE